MDNYYRETVNHEGKLIKKRFESSSVGNIIKIIIISQTILLSLKGIKIKKKLNFLNKKLFVYI